MVLSSITPETAYYIEREAAAGQNYFRDSRWRIHVRTILVGAMNRELQEEEMLRNVSGSSLAGL